VERVAAAHVAQALVQVLALHLQHTSAYVSTRQHTSAHVSTRQHTSAYVSIRQHSIRQHTSAYVSIRQHTSAFESRGAYRGSTLELIEVRAHETLRLNWPVTQHALRALLMASRAYLRFLWKSSESTRLQHTSAYVSIRQHTSAYVSIRQHTSAYLWKSSESTRCSSSGVSICTFALVKQVK
jgi:hypothetical protein